MALKLLQPGNQPLGQFDGLDAEYLTLKGGEVVTLVKALLSGSDKAAKDSFDGYIAPSAPGRPVVTRTVATSSRPLFLSDEGIAGYGTLFGTVVGGVVGQVTSGTVLGPHTATGSGKVTCWDKPGLYAVSLDAVDTATSDGVTPTNTSLTVGTSLTFVPASSSGGQLTPVGSTAAAGNTVVVARFVEFETTGSLVTSNNSMVTALNSPSGSSAPTRTFNFAVIHFNPPVA